MHAVFQSMSTCKRNSVATFLKNGCHSMWQRSGSAHISKEVWPGLGFRDVSWVVNRKLLPSRLPALTSCHGIWQSKLKIPAKIVRNPLWADTSLVALLSQLCKPVSYQKCLAGKKKKKERFSRIWEANFRHKDYDEWDVWMNPQMSSDFNSQWSVTSL